jgi:2,4-dienoyl-CoA reductase-like NADH-dependent reductase (Old Yellow Enzyme family)/NADPH-dependent 2,4-dienoyl-CoA reductase/sulfur reductase-like enzyme
MSKQKIFQPIKIGNIVSKNRIEVSPANNFLASADGLVTRELIECTRNVARGGAGIVTIGMSFVNPNPPELTGFALDLSTNKAVVGLSQLVETIHRYGAKASIELVYMAFAPPETMVEGIAEDELSQIRNETSINDKIMDKLPHELTIAEMEQIIQYFGDAADLCMRAGMDMILIHGGHGMLISQFLSPHANKRTDQYGGSVENRSRFAYELLSAIRERVGNKVAIEYRLSAEELTPNGTRLADTLEFAKIIQDKIDLIHVSAGDLRDDQVMGYVIQPTYYKRGTNVHYAPEFKRVLNIPVTTVGSIDMDMAEEIIDEDKADIVAMQRTFIADPDCVNKTKYGMKKTIRPCVRCNTCINQPHYFFLPVRCAVNPVFGKELEYIHDPIPANKKKVVIIGGGPAGMEAARGAADRGHSVVLFERNEALGGALVMASQAPFKSDMRKYLKWAIETTMRHPGITIKLGIEADPEKVMTEEPDTLIIAVGARPDIPSEIPGIDQKNVVWAGDVEMGKAQVRGNVVIAGGGLIGCETALHLAQQGKKVRVVEMQSLDEIVASAPIINMVSLMGLLKKHNAEYLSDVRLEGITDKSAIVKDKNEKRREIACDTVVLALGMIPCLEKVKEFSGLVKEEYVVGDCATRRGNLWNAITMGFNAAMNI